MPRRKYNPGGGNEYSTPQEKPPRYDLRRKHKIVDDPLLKKDMLKDEDMKLSEEIELNKLSDEEEFILAKKIALRKIKTAGEIKHIKDNSSVETNRQYVTGFPLKEEGMQAVAATYKCLGEAFHNMVKANNIFAKIKSSQISPDGRLGGSGFIQSIKSIRASLSNTVNVVSELLDTFYDEINSPHWQKQTAEMESFQKTVEEADNIINQAEEGLENKELNEGDKENEGSANSGGIGQASKPIQSKSK